jgi:hypothetical protein
LIATTKRVRAICLANLARLDRSLLVVTCLYWYLLVFTGLQWSSVVFTGIYWSSVVFGGLYWSLLVFTGLHWSPLVFTGRCDRADIAKSQASQVKTGNTEFRRARSVHSTGSLCEDSIRHLVGARGRHDDQCGVTGDGETTSSAYHYAAPASSAQRHNDTTTQ